jgi:hypothetical protein
MAIFNSYVKLPEGNNYSPLNLWLFFWETACDFPGDAGLMERITCIPARHASAALALAERAELQRGR